MCCASDTAQKDGQISSVPGKRNNFENPIYGGEQSEQNNDNYYYRNHNGESVPKTGSTGSGFERHFQNTIYGNTPPDADIYTEPSHANRKQNSKDVPAQSAEFDQHDYSDVRRNPGNNLPSSESQHKKPVKYDVLDGPSVEYDKPHPRSSDQLLVTNDIPPKPAARGHRGNCSECCVFNVGHVLYVVLSIPYHTW